MSKYIRTNNDIWIFLEDCKDGTALVHKPVLGYNLYVDIDKNTKIADTIEELCDEFICCVGIDNPHYEIYHATNENVANIRFWYPDITILYGAIWTEEGLIYIAKMNEKGELKLI